MISMIHVFYKAYVRWRKGDTFYFPVFKDYSFWSGSLRFDYLLGCLKFGADLQYCHTHFIRLSLFCSAVTPFLLAFCNTQYYTSSYRVTHYMLYTTAVPGDMRAVTLL